MRYSDKWIQRFFASKAKLKSDLDINGRNGGNHTCEELYSLITANISKQLQISDTDNVLEIGCGTGLIYSVLASGRSHCAAIDLSLDMLRIASRRGIKNLIQSCGDELPFKNESFTHAVCCGVLTNIQDDKIVDGILLELVRILKHGGYILIGDIPDIEITDFNSSWRPITRPKDLLINALRLFPYSDQVIAAFYRAFGKGVRPFYRSFHKDTFISFGKSYNLETRILTNQLSEAHFDVIFHKRQKLNKMEVNIC